MLESYGVEYIMLSTDDRNPLAREIGRSEHWKLVYWDDFAKIYVRNNQKNRHVIDSFTYEAIDLEDNMLSFLGDPDQAGRAFLELEHKLQESPNCSKAYGLQGVIYYSMDKLDSAITAYERSLSLNPEQLYLRYHLGIAYEFSGEYEKAIEQYRKEIKRTPYFSDTYDRLGIVYRSLGHVQQAERFEQKAERIRQ
jgi:tetratricopeptide (TPR) repeat protein